MAKWWVLGLLTVAIALGIGVACASGGDDDDDDDINPFCNDFCGKCAGCYDESSEWDDNDCRYQAGEGAFSLADCLAGCELGAIPSEVRPADFPDGWEDYTCDEFDGFL
jgi:hypothetical protein